MRNSRNDIGGDLGLLGLRLTMGGYMAAHGAQKLFGAFGGHGVEGTGGFMENLGLRPGREHAILAGVTEMGGGLLTAAGAASPVGPVAMMGPMVVAASTAHGGKGPFVQEGGWELPATNLGIAAALALTGPGRFAVDGALGIRLPRWVGAIALAGVAAGTAVTLARAMRAAQEDSAGRAEEEPAVELTGVPTEPARPASVEEATAPAG